MPANVSQILNLPYIQPSQAQKHVTHNEALRRLDVLVQLVVSSRSTTSPPADPPDGRRHIVPDGATGAWAGQAGKLAVFQENAWVFLDPLVGWQAYVKDENIHVTFESGAWTASALPTALQNLSMTGINTSADATNRLAVAADATLLSHDGDDHQLKINKAAAADTASLLFQSAWNGHAEMGLAGDNRFAIKVSDDGVAWHDAIHVDPSTQEVNIPFTISGDAVTQSATDTTSGRLIRVDDGYLKGSILGTVSETSGVPTGAVIERGSNSNGEYVRFADGTQICTHLISVGEPTISSGGVFRSPSVTWTFPAAFVANPRGLSASEASSAVMGANIRASSATTASVNIITWQSFASSRSANVMAIGRWF